MFVKYCIQDISGSAEKKNSIMSHQQRCQCKTLFNLIAVLSQYVCMYVNLCLHTALFFSDSTSNVLWTKTKGTSVVTAGYKSVSRPE